MDEGRAAVIRVAHVGAWGRNLGDRAIRASVHDALDSIAAKEFGEVVSVVGIDCQDEFHHTSPKIGHVVELSPWDGSTVDYVNANFDVLVVGGGGLIWDRPGMDSVSGWQWQIPFELLRRIEIPFVVHAVGAPVFPYNDVTGAPLLADHLAETIEQAALFSVRTPGVARWLEQWLGVNTDSIAITAGPALFFKPGPLPDDCYLIADSERSAPNVGLVWGSDNARMRYRSLRMLEAHTAAMQSALIGFAQRHGGSSVLVKHIAGDLDRAVASKLSSSRVFETNYVSSLAPLYDVLDVVASARKHGLILGAAAGVPVVGVGDVEEIRWTLDDLYGLPFAARLHVPYYADSHQIKETLSFAYESQQLLSEQLLSRVAELRETWISEIRQIIGLGYEAGPVQRGKTDAREAEQAADAEAATGAGQAEGSSSQ
jgi:hypothetical protein